MEITGQCLCGDVKYRMSGPLSGITTCHCSMCRQQSGSAFSVEAPIDPDSFKWIAGEELLSKYASSPEASRIFCRVCGSHIGLMEGEKVTYLFLGTISGDPGSRSTQHIFVGSKAPWHEITDDLPQYDEYPPSD